MKKWWNWVALGAVVIALVVAARILPLTTWLKSFREWAGQLGPFGFIVFVGVYALATVLFVPGWPLTIGAGLTFGLLFGTIAVSLGSIIGASLAFLIARFLARKQVEGVTAKNKRFQEIDKAIGHEGAKLIFLLRLSPLIPFNLSNYFYGITAVKFWPYFSRAGLGCFPVRCFTFILAPLARRAWKRRRTVEIAVGGNGLGLVSAATMSATASRPPGLKTRNASANTRLFSGERLMTQLEIMTSTLSFVTGSASISPRRNSTLVNPFFSAFLRAFANMSGVISTPMTLPVAPTARAARKESNPARDPHATGVEKASYLPRNAV